VTEGLDMDYANEIEQTLQKVKSIVGDQLL
jgi:hypothetical protein